MEVGREQERNSETLDDEGDPQRIAVAKSEPMIKFSGQQRCQRCVFWDQECSLSPKDDACTRCLDTRSPCVFERSFQVQGPAHLFTWEALKSERQVYHADKMLHPSEPIDSPLAIHSIPLAPQDHLDFQELGHTPWPVDVADVESADVNSNYDSSEQSSPSLVPLVLPSEAAARDHHNISTGFHSISTASAEARSSPHTNQSIPRGRKRHLSIEARDHARKVRNAGACSACRLRKIKCSHALWKPQRTVDNDSDENKSLHGDADSSTNRVTCTFPHCSATFRGAHELRRHCEAQHEPVREMWFCTDISSEKSLLTGCKLCESGKLYAAEYNAREHLRRTHFSLDTSTEELRKWVKKKEVESGELSDAPTFLSGNTEPLPDPLECDVSGCKTRFIGIDRMSNYRRHVRYLHWGQGRDRLRCAVCDRFFSRKDNLLRHIHKSHGPGRDVNIALGGHSEGVT